MDYGIFNRDGYTSDKGQADGSLAAFHCIVEMIKQAWPDVEIIFRGDAGFYTPELLDYCDLYGYKYILGFSSNAVLKRLSENIVFAAEMFFVESGSQESLRSFL